MQRKYKYKSSDLSACPYPHKLSHGHRILKEANITFTGLSLLTTDVVMMNDHFQSHHKCIKGGKRKLRAGIFKMYSRCNQTVFWPPLPHHIPVHHYHIHRKANNCGGVHCNIQVGQSKKSGTSGNFLSLLFAILFNANDNSIQKYVSKKFHS